MKTTIKIIDGEVTITPRNSPPDHAVLITLKMNGWPIAITRVVTPVQAVMLSQALDQAAQEAEAVIGFQRAA